MEWEDFQRVSTIANLVGERRGRRIMKVWKEGRNGGRWVRGRSKGRRTTGEERGRRRDEKESNKANARRAEVRDREAQ